jgi:hypothetical protein
MTGRTKRLLVEIARGVQIVTRVRRYADAQNEADAKAAVTNPIFGVSGWEVRDPHDSLALRLLVMCSLVFLVEARALNRTSRPTSGFRKHCSVRMRQESSGPNRLPKHRDIRQWQPAPSLYCAATQWR